MIPRLALAVETSSRVECPIQCIDENAHIYSREALEGGLAYYYDDAFALENDEPCVWFFVWKQRQLWNEFVVFFVFIYFYAIYSEKCQKNLKWG